MDLLPRREVTDIGKIGFTGFVSLLLKYNYFKKYDYNLLRDGTLSYNTFM